MSTLSPFHAYYNARKLSNYSHGKDKLMAAFASSDMEVYPYQIAAALFAMRSPYQKGVILADDGSLGKSFECLLIVSQKWYEGKQRILLVVPTQLLYQWTKIIEDRFSIPYISVDNNAIFNDFIKDGIENPFMQNAVVITTYDFAADKADYIEQIDWQITIFDEAHRLRRIYTNENKGAAAIQKAVAGSFKILMTATPMQNSILDLYGLINFIDENVFTDEKTFYTRYFRKPENYEELAERVSKYCFRTMRNQVSAYVKITERIPITVPFTLTDKEQKLYDLIEKYIQKPNKKAFPKMDNYELTLMLMRTFSSSTFAIKETLKRITERLNTEIKNKTDNSKDKPDFEKELKEIETMLKLAESIKENAKGRELLTALEKGFSELKRLGANKKVIIFTEFRATQKYLFELLNKGKYREKILIYNGDKSRDYTIMERFEKEAQILITTDLAAEGFSLEFCSFVVNFDMSYNTLKLEQRINRCHRQGQKCDVIVMNFLNINNFADVRMLELINKRILQFDGIFGVSDNVIGNFGTDLESGFAKITATARTKDEIDTAFNEILEKYETENKKIVQSAEHSLYTSFNKEIAEKVAVTPQYVKDMTKEINDNLWDITKYFLNGKQGYNCNDETRTVNIAFNPQKIFTGGHLGRQEYSMTDKTLPKSGWHTITGTLAKNIISEIFWIGVPSSGMIIVDGGKLNEESCSIAYYDITVKSANSFFDKWHYFIAVGKTKGGHIIDDEDCKAILELPVINWSAQGEKIGVRNDFLKNQKPHLLDELVEIQKQDCIHQTILLMDTPIKDEIAKLKAYCEDEKISLERNIEALRSEGKSVLSTFAKSTDMLEKLEIQKKKSLIEKDLKLKERDLYMDKVKLGKELEDKILSLQNEMKLSVEVKRIFVVDVKSNND